MTLDVIFTQYRRTAIGMVVLGALLSFAAGQRVGHGYTAPLTLARTHSIPAVTARASGDIGTIVPSAPTLLLGAHTANQDEHSGQKHSHGHGKDDSVTTEHSAGNGNGGGQND